MFDTLMRYHTMRRILLITSSILLYFCAIAQDSLTALSLFETEDGSPVEVILVTDMNQIRKAKYKEEYQPATIRIIKTPGDTVTCSGEIRSRGNMRKEVCFFPPMRIKFSKKEYLYNKLKWVNICENNDLNEQYLLKEYLIYRMFETLTERSLMARLLRVQYIDAGSGQHQFTRYAFVIENEDQIAARFGGRVYEPKILKDHLLDQEQLALFTFFQYMIGNTDWALANRHNVEVITEKSANALLAIPYDFDYSGFVNTGYAAPHETIPVSHVTVRYNKGYCIEDELSERMRQHFLSKKDAILNLCESFEPLDRKTRNSAIKFLDEFFKIMDDPKQTTRVFVKDCRNLPQ